MIHELENKHFDNQYRPDTSPEVSDYIFIFGKLGNGQDGAYLRVTDEGIGVPRAGEIADALKTDISEIEQTYLFSIDEDVFRLADDGLAEKLAEIDAVELELAGLGGYGLESMRTLRCCQPKDMCMAGMTANHLHSWYRDNRFCGRCGAETTHDPYLRMMKCPDCGNMIFPRLNPAVTVALRHEDKLLVSRYANRPGLTRPALIAGFVEIGETAEECVIREVMEEVGLKVGKVEYYGTQPWGFAGNLQMGYVAEVEGSDNIVLDEDELASAQFIGRDDLEPDPNPSSLTGQMINDFLEGKI